VANLLAGSGRSAYRPLVDQSLFVLHSSQAFIEGLNASTPTTWKWTDVVSDPSVILVEVHDGESWDQLASLASEHAVVVGVLPNLWIENYRHALALGAGGVADTHSDPPIIWRVLDAAVHGEVLLPREAARILAGGRVPALALSDLEVELLQALSEGMTLAQIASSEGWGERTLRRRLQNACIKLEARNRAEAIKIAAKLGIID
jgi:DNA-binding NarL/FixJ family response regulator